MISRDQCLEKAFHPKAVAIVGVSRNDTNPPPGYTGLRLLRMQQAAGFEGRLYPINPSADTIAGVKAYPTVTAVPEPLDLVIITVPAAAVPGVLEQCVAVKAMNVHICTAGFGETGEGEAQQIQQRVQEIAVSGGLQVVGPNCMGYHVPSAHMQMYDGVPMLAGTTAFVSQSGGHAQDFAGYGPRIGVGFSKVISYGNGLILDSTDFIEYLAGDPATRIICLYVEGVKDGRKLLEVVRKTHPDKPVIIWKGGLTPSGTRAAATHTASLSGDGRVWDAFFKQTRATRVGSVPEMADLAMTFLQLKPLLRARVSVIVGGGGNNVAGADTCTEEGIEVPAFSPETRARLLQLMSLVNQSVVNPIDGAGIFRNLPLLQQVLETIAADPLIDVIILHLGPSFRKVATPETYAGLKKLVADFNRQNAHGKPVVAAIRSPETAGEDTEPFIRDIREAGITTYYSLRTACRALRRFAAYHALRAERGPS